MPINDKLRAQIYADGGDTAVKEYEDYTEQYDRMMSDLMREERAYRFLPRSEKNSVTTMGMLEDDYSDESESVAERNNRRDIAARTQRIGRYGRNRLDKPKEEDKK